VADLWPPVAGAHDYVPRPRARWTAASAGLRGHTGPLRVSRPPVQATTAIAAAAVPAGHPAPGWNPWLGAGWDQQSLANSFSTMVLHSPPTSVQDWVTDSGATHHTTPSVGNISTLRPLASSTPSSIVVGNGSSLPITSVGDSVLPGPFYLNNILLTPDMVQSLLSVRCFTTDNWCSMEFDPFGLSVKDLTTKNMIVKSNSIGPLYTMLFPDLSLHLPALWPPFLLFPTPLLLLLRPRGTVILVILALTPYLVYLGHPLFSVPAINMIFVMHVS
jgi:hypothetical protein